MRKQVTWLAALAVFAMACSDPSAPTSRTIFDTPSSAIIPDANPTYPFPSSPADGLVTVCKVSDEAGTFEFTYSVNAGAPQQTSITINAGQENTRVCAAAPLHNSSLGSSALDVVTVTETDPGAGWTTTVDVEQHFDQTIVAAYDPNYLNDTFDNTTRSATVQINDDLEKVVVFTNTAPNDPPGNEGCTPGYWKADQHLDSWVGTGYTTGQTLESVFDVPNAFGVDNSTLLQALSFKGGSTVTDAAKLLLHHAVAALLNAGSPNVNYGMSEADIIADVNAALASNDRDTMLALKSDLDALNNAGCPLN